MTTIQFRKVATGEFDVLKDTVNTGYRIVNGSLGLSGRDTPNFYGIVTPSGRRQWVGTLQACKKLVTVWLTKKGA